MKRSIVGKITSVRREICMGFGCMEKNRSFPCGELKMIGSHPPVVPASHYISLFMHSR